MPAKRRRPTLDELASRTYTTSEVARLSGQSYKGVVNLADRKQITPDIQQGQGTGSRRLYSWANCLEAIIITALVKHGVPGDFAAQNASHVVRRRALWERVTSGGRMMMQIWGAGLESRGYGGVTQDYNLNEIKKAFGSRVRSSWLKGDVKGVTPGAFGGIPIQTVIDLNQIVSVLVERAWEHLD